MQTWSGRDRTRRRSGLRGGNGLDGISRGNNHTSRESVEVQDDRARTTHSSQERVQVVVGGYLWHTHPVLTDFVGRTSDGDVLTFPRRVAEIVRTGIAVVTDALVRSMDAAELTGFGIIRIAGVIRASVTVVASGVALAPARTAIGLAVLAGFARITVTVAADRARAAIRWTAFAILLVGAFTVAAARHDGCVDAAEIIGFGIIGIAGVIRASITVVALVVALALAHAGAVGRTIALVLARITVTIAADACSAILWTAIATLSPAADVVAADRARVAILRTGLAILARIADAVAACGATAQRSAQFAGPARTNLIPFNFAAERIDCADRFTAIRIAARRRPVADAAFARIGNTTTLEIRKCGSCRCPNEAADANSK